MEIYGCQVFETMPDFLFNYVHEGNGSLSVCLIDASYLVVLLILRI